MADLSGDRQLVLRRSLSGYGLISRPTLEFLDRVIAGGADRGWDRRVVARDRSFSEALDHLNTVTHPATRYVVFSLAPGWTAVINNERNGSDVADLLQHVGARLDQARSIRVVDQAAAFADCNGYRERIAYGSRIVEIRDGATVRRSVACADDGGRWKFEATGEPFSIEATFDYSARLTSHRFTSENVRALLESIGAPRFDRATPAVATDVTFLSVLPKNADWRGRIEAQSCTAAEAEDPARGYYRRALGWMDHLATHATSAVADLTRAVLLNPSLEPLARPALDRARAQLGKDAYQDAVHGAERTLKR